MAAFIFLLFEIITKIHNFFAFSGIPTLHKLEMNLQEIREADRALKSGRILTWVARGANPESVDKRENLSEYDNALVKIATEKLVQGDINAAVKVIQEAESKSTFKPWLTEATARKNLEEAIIAYNAHLQLAYYHLSSTK